ncbi:MAG: GTPase HflX, partial [Vicinamibacteria bacterium]
MSNKTKTERNERALICGTYRTSRDRDAAAISLEEMRQLAESAGAVIVEVISQERKRPDSATYFGSGKVEELKAFAEENKVTIVMVDAELSPVQARNLESALDVKVLDRTELILDIFAQRARSREGRLQVELAQLQYLMPRLTGKGVSLSRLGGGIGTRGPGETKLETDRRRIRTRVSVLKE